MRLMNIVDVLTNIPESNLNLILKDRMYFLTLERELFNVLRLKRIGIHENFRSLRKEYVRFEREKNRQRSRREAEIIVDKAMYFLCDIADSYNDSNHDVPHEDKLKSALMDLARFRIDAVKADRPIRQFYRYSIEYKPHEDYVNLKLSKLKR